jgi:glutathione S-transferase
MLTFYYHSAPDPAKVALPLEEAALPCEPLPVEMRKGRALHERCPLYLRLVSAWGAARARPVIMGENTWMNMPHLMRLFEVISARPPAARANAPADRQASRIEMYQEAQRNLFPQNLAFAT